MALANFFDKAALGAAKILKDFDRTAFESLLDKHQVGIVFDKIGGVSSEGKATLDLLVRLLARLYPNLQIIDSQLSNPALVKELEECAISINPEINLSKNVKPTVYLIVGNTPYKTGKNKKFYLGSHGWTVKFSDKKPVNSGNTQNPFAAGAAACFGAANLFRLVFKDQLPKGNPDKDFALSLFEFAKNDSAQKIHEPLIDNIHLEDSLLVGVGAVGNAVIWALGNIPSLTGKLEIIDDQDIDLSNLQRYILARQKDVTISKVLRAGAFMENSKLKIVQSPFKWEKYIQKRNNWSIKRIAVCVDSAKDRITVQGSLPKKIFNAWTQQEALGVSRHTNLIKDPCLTCLYMPESKKKSKSVIIAESLGLAAHELMVRGYLAQHLPVDINILSLVSAAKGIPMADLQAFEGKHLEVFYSEVVCGGVMMRLENKSEVAPQIEVPSAFESALAGILLAAELIIDAGSLRKKSLPIITRFNLLRPLSNYLLEDQYKHHSGKCICQDPIFQEAYNAKWANFKLDSKKVKVEKGNKIVEALNN